MAEETLKAFKDRLEHFKVEEQELIARIKNTHDQEQKKELEQQLIQRRKNRINFWTQMKQYQRTTVNVPDQPKTQNQQLVTAKQDRENYLKSKSQQLTQAIIDSDMTAVTDILSKTKYSDLEGIQPKQQLTPLALALRLHRIDMIKALLKHGASLASLPIENYTDDILSDRYLYSLFTADDNLPKFIDYLVYKGYYTLLKTELQRFQSPPDAVAFDAQYILRDPQILDLFKIDESQYDYLAKEAMRYDYMDTFMYLLDRMIRSRRDIEADLRDLLSDAVVNANEQYLDILLRIALDTAWNLRDATAIEDYGYLIKAALESARNWAKDEQQYDKLAVVRRYEDEFSKFIESSAQEQI